jgi:hypothetical protein
MSAAELISLADRHYAPGDPARKGARHFRVYGEMLAGLRELPIALLELGIYRGSSLKIWRDYLPKAVIVGLDIEHVEMPDLPDVHIVQGDQADPAALDRAISANGGAQFDIIIDDASHLGLKSKASFAHLFLHGLKPGGRYFVEDIAAPFLQGWADGERWIRPPAESLESYQSGLMGFLKQLIDEMAVTAAKLESPFPIAEIKFYPNMCVIGKMA